MRMVPFLFLVILTGCAGYVRSSQNAGKEQIEAHLRNLLHCQRLELTENNHDDFSGFGKNGSGEFTINVARHDGKLTFNGAYTGQNKGTFSGSEYWRSEARWSIGYHKASESTETSVGTP